eukprot:3421294-Amphidinium_carterae.1
MGLAFDIGWATVGCKMVKFIFPVFCVTCPKHIGECQFVLTSSISVCSAISIEHSGPRHSMSSVVSLLGRLLRLSISTGWVEHCGVGSL